MNEKRAAILHSRLRSLAERRVDVDLVLHAKPGGRDSDDGVRFPLEDKLLPDCLSASAETAAPQTIADDRDRRCARLVFLRQKRATFDWRDAENRKQSGRDLEARNVLRLPGPGYRASSISPCSYRSQSAARALIVVKLGIGKAPLLTVLIGLSVQSDQPVGFQVSQRL